MCNLLPFGSVWISFIAFGLVYCNAVTLITDLICALFGPYAAMFVNQIYPGKSLKTSFVSPAGKPWNLVFASPGKSWKTVFYCLYEPWLVTPSCHTHTHTQPFYGTGFCPGQPRCNILLFCKKRKFGFWVNYLLVETWLAYRRMGSHIQAF